ncbi:hypothetical protein [Arthrobacter sp. 9E06]|nr:hypothetical protein [Arthrobacter sp. 9E06]
MRVVPNHVCLAINLVDSAAVISAGKIKGRWTVAARGKNA